MKGRRVTLVRPTEADYELIAEWLGPASPTAVLTADTGEFVTPEDLKRYNDSGEIRQFAVRTLDGTTVGTVNYRRQGPVGSYVIGGAIGDPSMWQRGLGAEAFDLLIDHLFHARNAHRMQFTTALYNKSVLRMVTRAGFVLEGILREYHYLDGRYHHAAVWSLLRHEYYDSLAEQARRTPGFTGPDAIPESAKAEALAVLCDHLRRPEAETSIKILLEDADAEAASRAAARTAGAAAAAAALTGAVSDAVSHAVTAPGAAAPPASAAPAVNGEAAR
ncbi:GNAT family N-acetyltransferase [Streptomyces sp. WAC 00631]|uniref:GNAT family N-acetyltransferase n=1 Tax=Streptomyces sp. WAC 00631 TaxID=2203201 RepID=UPI000F798188|nr:GNAT family protein [Streptomyces sp. WAC 00631]MCC5035587.1 GNAT family N-acetyltransferase [Streptomyces sp. WAC 00631]